MEAGSPVAGRPDEGDSGNSSDGGDGNSGEGRAPTEERTGPTDRSAGSARTSRRAPAGAAVLRTEVTEAIRAAVFAELAAVGYGRMSMEGIARRAGVGKAAVYRRWRAKLPLVLDLVPDVAAAGLPVPDTGSLLGDVRALLQVGAGALRHPLAVRIVPDLLAEAARTPELAGALATALRETHRAVTSAVLRQAAARGEIAADTDPALALDLLAGPLYWRLTVLRESYGPGGLDALAAAVVAALVSAAPAGP
ncbi:TetR/AcrR family transcriptional regulator [Streptomyces sp. NBC_01190]|uniref:TetR/AcrR family transcriptional regulator n=1 Tax=Streptomyces sp. NBC_01190 TaxID=2903767 RepID=UPI0038670772|nr:TetR/AcrR family transcriptional regulator [Streptomyces sp. NBC_01190]